jgi:hypothetical protein
MENCTLGAREKYLERGRNKRDVSASTTSSSDIQKYTRKIED